MPAQTTAIRAASTSTTTIPTTKGEQSFTFTWGRQTDIRTINPTTTSLADDSGEVSDTALAGYIAKYATKGTGISDGADRRIRCADDIEALPISDHHKQMIRTAWNLGAHPDLAHLRRWAHMLGFRGHFLTKSRRYSLTFTAIRGHRHQWQRHQALTALGTDPEQDTVLVINDWRYDHTGYRSEAEYELAAAIYQRKQHQHTRRDTTNE